MMTSDPDGVVPPPPDAPADQFVLEVVEERLAVGKARVAGATVRVSTTTEVVEEIAEVELDRYRVEIKRVPIGKVVETAPLARVECDTTIVPVLEERFVVVKQLFLTEELHIRHVVEREVVREPVSLRRQRATVERSNDRAEVVGPDEV